MAIERRRIGLREVAALAPNQEVWDSAVAGFGARRQRSKSIAYVVLYRTRDGRPRRYTIGRHGAPWTPETARIEAKRLLGLVADGADPAGDKRRQRSQITTVAELCDEYLQEAEAGRLLTRRRAGKKLSTLMTDRGRVVRHIKPLLGKLSVAAVARDDVERFMHAVAEGKSAVRVKTKARGVANVRGGRGTATRTVGLLGAIFGYAVRQGLRVDNPVHGVTRFADGKRQRRLIDAEYALVGMALSRAIEQQIWQPAVDAIRALALTGWRRGEVLALRWSELDLARRTACLGDTKTGASMRPLARPVIAILAARERDRELVFPASRGDGSLTGFTGFWERVMKLGDVPRDITPHLLRHSFASVAADLGYGESTIAALIGHRSGSITARYIHSADAVLLGAADRIAAHIQQLMKPVGPKRARRRRIEAQGLAGPSVPLSSAAPAPSS
ncbi:tyrosine-type recombinase/integrase [Falsiroseomonas sp. HC035]|uniref:tyrosine-type recombinase/integrase n=1 Tax=Falsiroseomonas sp. HC035 TaxID=3390999 RepID=UPI003D322054